GAAPRALGEAPAQHEAKRPLLDRAIEIERALEDPLELEERVVRQDLTIRDERLEGGRSGPESLLTVARGELDLGGRGHDRSALHVVIEVALHAEHEVAEAAGPRSRAGALPVGERDDHLHLVAGAEALLVDELAAVQARSAERRSVGEDRLVLGIRLLGHHRARQVQLAAGPRVVSAER